MPNFPNRIPPPDPCSGWTAQIYLSLRGDATQQERQALRIHLAQCHGCGERLRKAQLSLGGLALARQQALRAGPSLWAAVKARLPELLSPGPDGPGAASSSNGEQNPSRYV
ncbi:MAG TPA: hypothetical protein PKA37_06055 [Planctomycetota bacterium]|jgi:hypothetical protein|nr:hypothetical protein [Planctomycetota bacterium]